MRVTLSRLGSVQRNLEKLDESIKSLQEAQEMFEYNDIYSAVILSKLSVVYRHNGNPTNSLYFAEKASEITDKHHGAKDHPGKRFYSRHQERGFSVAPRFPSTRNHSSFKAPIIITLRFCLNVDEIQTFRAKRKEVSGQTSQLIFPLGQL